MIFLHPDKLVNRFPHWKHHFAQNRKTINFTQIIMIITMISRAWQNSR